MYNLHMTSLLIVTRLLGEGTSRLPAQSTALISQYTPPQNAGRPVTRTAAARTTGLAHGTSLGAGVNDPQRVH